ncbi:MAG TPA: apolipoprotein N-acyltransferase [Candidatus Binatia bacterium]|jgi:apolipoprotein N-acyltransferase
MQGPDQGKSPRLWIAVLATSLLYSLAQPPWSLWPLALVAAAPAGSVLLDESRRISPARAAVGGLLFGAASTWMIAGYWSYLAAGEFSGSALSALAFAIALPLLASAVAVPYAIAFALISRLAGLGTLAAVAGSAALWSAAELARSTIGYGNPWGSFAVALAPADYTLAAPGRIATPVAALLAIGGPCTVALVAAASGTAIAMAWNSRRSPLRASRALAAGAVVLALGAASVAVLPLLPARPDSAVPKQPLRVALVQGGVGGRSLWKADGAAASLAHHVELTRSRETAGADLIVWSESALPFLLDANADRKEEMKTLARERGAAILVGGSRSAPSPHGTTEVFNSAFLFPADGSEPFVYDKRVLLPFVEKVPAWASFVLESPWRGAFAEGRGPELFTIKGWRIAPLICLESIYAGQAAERAASGADLLVNLSNDSWFDSGAGPDQHFAQAALAAAETRRPLVRVAMTGLSGLVTEDGQVAWTLPRRAPAVALIDVPAPSRDSFFVRGGRIGIPFLVLAIAAAAALLPGLVRPDSRRL